MKKTISKILVFAMVVALFAFGTGMATASAASDYPSKNITVICPYGAGGTTDLCIRGMVDAIPDGTLPKRVNILTNNVTGAAGLVGSTQFVNSPSDGYTLGILNCDLILHNVKGTTEISYDQFTPVACLMNQPNLVVVNTEGKFNSFEDLMNYAKENPGELKVANSGEGGIPRLCAQAVEQALGLEFKYINYDSDGACAVAVVAGDACFSTGNVDKPYLSSCDNWSNGDGAVHGDRLSFCTEY